MLVRSKVSVLPEQQCYLSFLPDNLIWDILEWSRPGDQDHSIWLWLCRISATCSLFRRLVRMERKGAPSLMPTMFQLVPNCSYFNEGSNEDELPNFDEGSNEDERPVAPRVKLMNTMRRSSWMGLGVTYVCAITLNAFYDENGLLNWSIMKPFKALLTSPCLPRLSDVKVLTEIDGRCLFALTKHRRFLRDLAQAHPGLTSLFLAGHCHRVPAPDVFAGLSASFNGLKHSGIDSAPLPPAFRIRAEHLTAFTENLNPNLESLTLDFPYMGDVGFASVEAHCPNLKAIAFVLAGFQFLVLQVSFDQKETYLVLMQLNVTVIVLAQA